VSPIFAVVLALQIAAPPPSGLLVDGVAALNAGRPDLAVPLMEGAVAADRGSRLALLHLANAQRAARQRDAALRTLETLLRANPNDMLALWNLASVEGDSDPSFGTLRRLIAIDPTYPHALVALASLQTLRARDAYRSGKRGADVRVEDGEWIADAQPRATVRAAAARALDEAQAACERARAADSSPDALVLLNLTLRMQSEIADDAVTAKRLVVQANELVQQAAVLRRQQSRPFAPFLYDASVPPPPFPMPGPPPPPPPR
jgi:tetratricopeptide (TPR) repeat protein